MSFYKHDTAIKFFNLFSSVLINNFEKTFLTVFYHLRLDVWNSFDCNIKYVYFITIVVFINVNRCLIKRKKYLVCVDSLVYSKHSVRGTRPGDLEGLIFGRIELKNNIFCYTKLIKRNPSSLIPWYKANILRQFIVAQTFLICVLFYRFSSSFLSP